MFYRVTIRWGMQKSRRTASSTPIQVSFIIQSTITLDIFPTTIQHYDMIWSNWMRCLPNQAHFLIQRVDLTTPYIFTPPSSQRHLLISLVSDVPQATRDIHSCTLMTQPSRNGRCGQISRSGTTETSTKGRRPKRHCCRREMAPIHVLEDAPGEIILEDVSNY